MGYKKRLKTIWNVAKTEFLKVIVNPRLVVLMVVYVFVKTCCIMPLVDRAELMGDKIHILEPFIAIGNSGIILLILPLVYLFLISDFPKRDGNRLLFVSRIGRKKWVSGQLLFCAITSLGFLLLTGLGSVCAALGSSSWQSDWSSSITKFNEKYPDLAGGYASELIPSNLYNQMTPNQAVIHTFFLNLLYLILLGVIMLLLDELGLRVIRLLCAASLIVFGTAFTALKSDIMWGFPMSHAVSWLHFNEYLREPKFHIGFSYLYFGIGIVAFSIASYFCAKYMTFYEIEED